MTRMKLWPLTQELRSRNASLSAMGRPPTHSEVQSGQERTGQPMMACIEHFTLQNEIKRGIKKAPKLRHSYSFYFSRYLGCRQPTWTARYDLPATLPS